jgi:hypothetical protein
MSVSRVDGRGRLDRLNPVEAVALGYVEDGQGCVEKSISIQHPRPAWNIRCPSLPRLRRRLPAFTPGLDCRLQPGAMMHCTARR